MSEIVINNDYDFAHWQLKIRFAEDGRVVVLGYCRVSSAEQEEENFSLPQQMEQIRRACERRFGKGKFHIIFILEDVTGKLPYNRGGMKKGTYREGLTLAARIFEAGYAKYLVVYKMNRLTRKTRVWLELEEDVLRPNGVEFFAAAESIGNVNAASRFFTNIIAASAESERDNIAQVSADGLRSRMQKRYFTGHIPFGWRWDDKRHPGSRSRRTGEANGDEKQRRDIEPDPETAPYVELAYDWLLSGKSPSSIADEFRRLGLKTGEGSTEWDVRAIRRVLTNPVHAGLVRLDGEIVEGHHYEKRIVQQMDYYSACERFALERKVSRGSRKTKQHVFGSIARCGMCDSRMRIRYLSSGERYRCESVSSDVHPAFGVSLARADKLILESIRQIANDREFLDMSAQTVTALLFSEQKRLEDERRRLTSQIEKKKREVVEFCERWTENSRDSDGPPNTVVFDIYKNRLTDDISNLEARLAEVNVTEKQEQLRSVQLEKAIAVLADFDQLWQDMDLHEKKVFASYVIEELKFVIKSKTWVEMRLKLILSDLQTFSIPVRGRGGRKSSGLDSLSRAELTLAYYLLQGYSMAEIAEEREISPVTAKWQKWSLIKRTGADSVEEALAIVRPIVESRKDELLNGRRSGAHYKLRFTSAQIDILGFLKAGCSARDIAEKTGRSLRGAYRSLSRIYLKLGVHDADDAVSAAQRLHLISGSTIWSEQPTEKQLAVLTRLSAGDSQPEAAQSLGITLSAVKERIKCMFSKFGVHSQSELLILAHERGWL